MDRRNNNETAVGLTDEQFRKALEVIVDSYKGASADRIYSEAIGCFGCLMEISHNTGSILPFARRHDIDLKYLVDGANFVISKMHFNPGGNYYITLGLSQNVSHEEIRERWKKLMLLYHPDRQDGDDSWVSERAKKVNEAYNILKDSQKREAFDRKLLEEAIARKPVPQSRKASVQTPSNSSRKISRDPEWDRRKKNIPKFLVGGYLIAALISLGYMYFQKDTEHLESFLGRGKGLSDQAGLTSGAVPEEENSSGIFPQEFDRLAGNRGKDRTMHAPSEAGPPSQGQKAESRGVLPKSGAAVISDAPVVPGNTGNVIRQETGPGKVIAREDPAPKKSIPLLSPPVADMPPVRHAETRQTEPKLSVPSVKDIPAADYGARKAEPARDIGQEALPAHPAQNLKTAALTHKEVEDFMKRYSSAYSRGDLNSFMSLLSKSVVENNRLRFNAVREAYRETFSEKIGFYRVNNMIIMLNGPNADVSGVYDVSRYTSAEDRWIRYSGRIQWKISKENNELKIISLSYDK